MSILKKAFTITEDNNTGTYELPENLKKFFEGKEKKKSCCCSGSCC